MMGRSCVPELETLQCFKQTFYYLLCCIITVVHISDPLQETDEEADAGPVEEDSYGMLISGGVHPLLAARAADTAFPEAFVLAWSLLLACMMDSSHDRRRRLGLTCGHVDRYEIPMYPGSQAVLMLRRYHGPSTVREFTACALHAQSQA